MPKILTTPLTFVFDSMGLLLSLVLVLLSMPLVPLLNWPISFIKSFQSGRLAGFFFNCSSFSLLALLMPVKLKGRC